MPMEAETPKRKCQPGNYSYGRWTKTVSIPGQENVGTFQNYMQAAKTLRKGDFSKFARDAINVYNALLEQKPLPCPYCGASFADEDINSWRLHIMGHFE